MIGSVFGSAVIGTGHGPRHVAWVLRPRRSFLGRRSPPWPIRIRRIYDEPDGGTRILVDRLWPRCVSKQQARLDHWAKDLAPSDELRKAYHDGMPFEAFAEAYREELAGKDLSELEGDDVVLLTAVKGRPCHADVLAGAAAAGD